MELERRLSNWMVDVVERFNEVKLTLQRIESTATSLDQKYDIHNGRLDKVEDDQHAHLDEHRFGDARDAGRSDAAKVLLSLWRNDLLKAVWLFGVIYALVRWAGG